MSEPRETYTVQVAGLTRELPLFEVAPGIRIAVLNILGDTELVGACSRELAEKLRAIDYDALVTAEAKSIPLAHVLSSVTDTPYIVLRKNYKPYMGVTLYAETLSITTGKPQVLYLDEKDHELIRSKKVILLDDVISTGSTLKGMRRVVEKAGAKVVGQAAIFTEGNPDDWNHIVALGHLPIFKD